MKFAKFAKLAKVANLEGVPFQLSLENLVQVAADLAKELLPLKPLVLVRGEMGSGKSTLVSALLQAVGFSKTQGSPTFPICLYYPKKKRVASDIYHMDWYRVESEAELEERGIFEIFSQKDCAIFIEWPDKFPDAWIWIKKNKTRPLFEINIEGQGNDIRQVIVQRIE